MRRGALVGSSLAVMVLAVTLPVATAHAWGERGHDLVARVAARLVAQREPGLGRVLVSKEHLLGHVANVPDIVWRGADKATADANAPTHFINWDKLVTSPTLANVPRDFAAATQLAKAHHIDFAKDVGTAPWRIQQLAALMQQAFADGDTDRALLYGGLAAHFVGDMAQPYHAIRDYDGWATGQGGIHAYFETNLVSALPLAFDAGVYDYALVSAPARALIARAGANDPLSIAIAESLDAASFVTDVRALDATYALVTKSSGDKAEPHHKAAVRKPAEAVASHFEPRLRERLATAADVLATLWIDAWERAGRPDLTKFHSFAYPLAPEFVPPSYITR